MILMCATCKTELAKVPLPLVEIGHAAVRQTKCPVDVKHRVDGWVPREGAKL